MKKTLFIIAHLALLVSCAKTLEVDSEKSGKAESSGEIMLSTSANLTKAITEGKNLPYGSVIGLYTNFYSDVKTKDKGVRNPYYDYNQIKSFTYDFRTDVWRGASPVEALSELVMRGTRNFSEGSFKDSNLLDELLSNAYKTSSLYWPGEERVYMDYTAYSTSNLMSVLGQLLLLNFSDELSLDESKIASLDSMIVLNPMGAGEPKNLSHSFGDDRNYNKMAIGYNFGIFNDLPKIMQKAFDGPYLKPGALAIIIGLCAITNTSTGFDDLDADLHLDNGAVQSLIMEFISDGKLNMAAVNNLLNMSNEEFSNG